MHAGGQQLHVIFSFEKKRPSPNYLNRLNDRLNSSQVGLSLSTFNLSTFSGMRSQLSTHVFQIFSF